MKPIGITRVRNESLIIQDTIHHFLEYCEGIILYDDCSTDNTVDLAITAGRDRIAIIHGDEWRKDRVAENTRHRKRLLEAAKSTNNEWCLCFDADERLVGNLPLGLADGYRFKLFDGYLTHERQDEFNGVRLETLPRMWGPEYRDIMMLFKINNVRFDKPGMRVPNITGTVDDWPGMIVKHYGKCLSVEHWEETCEYYTKYFPKSFRDRWEPRKGKAIHTKSDFGRDIYAWHVLMNDPHVTQQWVKI